MVTQGPADGPRRRKRWGVVVIERLPVVRAGLRLLIDASPHAEVIGQAGTALDGLHLVAGIRRSRVVVLVGTGLPEPTGAFGLIRALHERFPQHVVLALGANADGASVSRAMFVGADGFVDKSIDPSDFVSAVLRAARGEVVVAVPDTVTIGAVASGLDRSRHLHIALTEREREVLSVAAEGLTARQIGERLGVRERTVTTHLARIYGKLGVGNRLAAIRVAATSGLVAVASGQ
jgi:DNA-binding NarL/FixJ family response regulator